MELTSNLRRLLSIHLRLWRASILIILLKILEITHSFMYSSHKPLTEERQWKVPRAGAGAVIRGHSPPHALKAKFSVRSLSEGNGKSLEFYVGQCPEHLAAITLGCGGHHRNR